MIFPQSLNRLFEVPDDPLTLPNEGFLPVVDLEDPLDHQVRRAAVKGPAPVAGLRGVQGRS